MRNHHTPRCMLASLGRVRLLVLVAVAWTPAEVCPPALAAAPHEGPSTAVNPHPTQGF